MTSHWTNTRISALTTEAITAAGMALNNNLVCSALIMAGLSMVERVLLGSDKNNEKNPSTYITEDKYISGVVTRHSENVFKYITAIACITIPDYESKCITA